MNSQQCEFLAWESVLNSSPIDDLENYRKRGSASYVVREVHLVREREREREIQREKDGRDVTIVALKLAMNLHFPFAKNSHNWR